MSEQKNDPVGQPGNANVGEEDVGNDNNNVLEGIAPTTGQEEILKTRVAYWQKAGDDAQVQALSNIEDAAKQLVGLTTGLQGLYLAIFAFSNIRGMISNLNIFVPNQIILLVFFLPIPLWLMSLFYATQVFIPQVRVGANLNDLSEDAWKNIKNTFQETVKDKLKLLKKAHRWLIASFIVALALLVLLVILPQPPDPGPTKIIILTPTPTPGLPVTPKP